ncbi:hypothetical protein NPIL_513331 [Nephila pilipes]|uniref:Uncharacterized protein n=1 Tax=Nephila pilipes TaxID=299642 RepID=A0A8X6QTN2_NEPPI|nr:hypothetical protein NPIL_513331 [Nephila pilipes]
MPPKKSNTGRSIRHVMQLSVSRAAKAPTDSKLHELESILQEVLKSLKSEIHTEKLTRSESILQDVLKHRKSEITSSKSTSAIFYFKSCCNTQRVRLTAGS